MTDTSQEVRDRVAAEQLLDATRAGRAPHPDSPSGRSLLSSYRRYQEAEQARKQDASSIVELRDQLESLKATLQPLTEVISKTLASPHISTPKVVEESAQRHAEQAMKGALLAGDTVNASVTKGWDTYRSSGGQLTLAAWKKVTATR
ncbi:MAG: hypothetical protein ABSC31_01810 [Acidimicrobiales bacterium]|jgi:hypothetical protein